MEERMAFWCIWDFVQVYPGRTVISLKLQFNIILIGRIDYLQKYNIYQL